MKLSTRSRSLLSARISYRTFSNASARSANRILDPVRTPPTFHDYLRSSSSNNSLMLALFTTSACTPCRTITPLLTSIIEGRSSKPTDSYSSVAFTEVELDSPDASNGSTMELSILYGVNSLPTLIGFGGRRAEIVTERITDTKMLSDSKKMEQWIDKQMQKGDQHPSEGGGGQGILQRIFG